MLLVVALRGDCALRGAATRPPGAWRAAPHTQPLGAKTGTIPAMEVPESRSARAALVVVRYGLPAALVGAGVTLVLLRASDEAVGMGVGLSMAALVVLLLNVFMRAGIRSQEDRDREEEARRHFDRHGRWPADGDG